jgi:3'-phosphoadenosine 5'-phosphosulfate sulfotransferase (PAPS reductase)/FAD synthetase
MTGNPEPTLFLRLRDPSEPTDAQKEAGNYAKRKVSWNGLTISIECEAGHVRRGVEPNGQPWATRLMYPYGYVNRTTGMDGDQVDVYLGPLLDFADTVYIVHQRQYGNWSEFDEDKCLIGFPDEESARDAYLSCYDDPRFLGPITPLPVAEFVRQAKETIGDPSMIKSVLFIKADQMHLFEKLVNVKAAIRSDGHVVSAHTAIRHVKGPAPLSPDLFGAKPRADYAERLAKPQPRLVLPVKAPVIPHVDEKPAPIPPGPDLMSYDKVLVAFSGGKDSVASLIAMLEHGVPPERIELHHHDIDGEGDSGLMDWPITRGYCKAVADALGLPIFFSWREGGFEREMLRENSRTAPVVFETPEGELKRSGGTGGKESTRRKFPQVSADLNTRWCSGKLKIDVMDSLIANQPRFNGKRILVVTGERAEESSNRAKYETFEPHRTHAKTKRHADAYRPVHAWTEGQVWGAMKRRGIVPHPAYQLGFGRLSCRTCIFGSDNQWSTINSLYPDAQAKVAKYEEEFGVTIHRKMNVTERAARGKPYQAAIDQPELAKMADQRTWNPTVSVLVPPDQWKLPAGAFGEKDGPC